MGTVTAIGEYRPERPVNSWTYPTTTTGTMTTVIRNRASIALDSWEAAIGAAMVAARSSRGVRVNKVGGEWVVSWDAPVLINPVYPTYPSYPQPWTYPYVTYSNGGNTS